MVQESVMQSDYDGLQIAYVVRKMKEKQMVFPRTSEIWIQIEYHKRDW